MTLVGFMAKDRSVGLVYLADRGTIVEMNAISCVLVYKDTKKNYCSIFMQAKYAYMHVYIQIFIMVSIPTTLWSALDAFYGTNTSEITK